MSQSTTQSVRDLLPDHCFLNVDDDDFVLLNEITDVEDSFFPKNSQVEENDLQCENSDSSSDCDNEYHELSETGVEAVDVAHHFDYREEDLADIHQTETFLGEGCGCKLFNGLYFHFLKIDEIFLIGSPVKYKFI